VGTKNTLPGTENTIPGKKTPREPETPFRELDTPNPLAIPLLNWVYFTVYFTPWVVFDVNQLFAPGTKNTNCQFCLYPEYPVPVAKDRVTVSNFPREFLFFFSGQFCHLSMKGWDNQKER